METTAKAAIGKVVLRQKEHLVAIRAYQKGLLMTLLYFKDEVIPIEQLEELKHTIIIKENEVNLAKILINNLSGDFQIDKYHDEYITAVQELIKKKAAGEKIETKPIGVKPTPQRDLIAALKASVETAKKKKK